MKSIKKILIIVLLTVIASLFFLQYKFKSEIMNVIENKLPSNIILSYSQIDASIISGSVELDSLSIKLLNTDNTISTSLDANRLTVAGFSIWQFLLNNTISIEDIVFDGPDLQYYQNREGQHRPKDDTVDKQFDKTIKIDNFLFKNGTLKVNGTEKNSSLLSLDSIHFTLNGFHSDGDKIKQKIPFEYEDYQLKGKHLFFNMSKYEILKIEDLAVEDDKLNLTNLFIAPKFTKEELSRKIAVERDHMQLHIPQFTLHELNFGFNTKFFIAGDSINITKPEFVIYRDKRVADDMTIKKMYSRMLRDLSFDLSIAEIIIEQGYISYAERVEKTNEAGKIFFKDIDANLTNLSNTYKVGGKTSVSARSHFMGKAPMNLDISFDVNNKRDVFLASGEFKNFDAEIANTFFESNLNAKAEGEIEHIYFTFNGNNFNSKGDLKMKYKAFKFEILKKNSRVNKVLTAIGNIFVNDGSKTDQDGFRHGKIEVERNQVKSFFNYLWINIEDGLISTLTGSGEKK